MRVRGGLLLAVLFITGSAAPARAQGEITPYLGVNLAGNVEFRRGGPGLSIGYVGHRLGFEFDVERYNHFFKDEDIGDIIPDNCGAEPAAAGPTIEPCTDANTDALGFMGNVVVPIRFTAAARWHPYAIAGGGVIRAWVDDPSHQLADTDQNNLALDAGGGVSYALNERTALRADLRYARTFVDEHAHEGG
jgi:opacity protein-like surface antigen